MVILRQMCGNFEICIYSWGFAHLVHTSITIYSLSLGQDRNQSANQSDFWRFVVVVVVVVVVVSSGVRTSKRVGKSRLQSVPTAAVATRTQTEILKCSYSDVSLEGIF